MVALKKGDLWVEGVDEFKIEVKNHFQNFFLESDNRRTILDNIQFAQILVSDNANLKCPFTMEEIKEVVWSYKGDNSPGPDGLNFTLNKQFWDLIKYC